MEKDKDNPLFKGLEKILNSKDFSYKKKEVTEKVFNLIFESSNLKWERTGDNFLDFQTEVEVENICGEIITTQIFLCQGKSVSGLYLLVGGINSSVCRNEADPRVKKLYNQITGEEV